MAMPLEEYEAKRGEIDLGGPTCVHVLDFFPAAQAGIRSVQAHDSTLVTPELTRFDPSTKTRVPVTQEWVDEAVAEIVRLNIELSAMPGSDPGVALQEVDHIWEAVRAASAV